MPSDRNTGQVARLELFGGPTLVVEDEEISLSPLQSWLLAILGWAGSDGLSRERIIHLLWDEDPDSSARHRLSQLLYALSGKVEPLEPLLADAERIRLDPTVLRTDVQAPFPPAEDTGDPTAPPDGSTFVPELPQAPTRPAEEWLHRTRVRMRGELRERAVRLWSEASEDQRWDRAEAAARALLDLDPDSEEALRRLMLSRGMAGRIEEGIAAYVGFSERRASGSDGSDWTPEPETASLLQRLEELEAVPQPPPEVQIGPRPEDPPLCGRDEEAATLGRLLAGPPSSGITTVVVSGEGGIGKTRLVEEVARNARLRDYLVLRGGTSEFEQDIPLNLLLDALDDEAVGDALNELEDPWRSVLLALLPQFHREEGALPEVPEIRPGNIPRRMYQAMQRLVEAVADRDPLFLFLDDFQWADETSVAALEFLRKRWSGEEVVLVLALRGSGLRSDSPPRRFVDEILAEDRTLHLTLGELAPDASRQVVRETGGREMDDEACEQISALGGRSPFFLVELTHEYLDGRLAEWMSGEADTLVVPVSIQQVLEGRFAELTEDDVYLLEVLTVHDRPVPWSALPEIAQRNPEQCVPSIERLQAVRLVSWEDEGLAVRHELIRHATYGKMSRARRILLHERIARGLLRSDAAEQPDELALHFDRAEIRDEALKYSLQAADRAEASGAVPEALRFLKMARRNTDDPVVAADIVGRLGHLNYLHRNLQDAAPLLELASSRFREQGRIDRALRSDVERIDALSRMESLPVQDFLTEIGRVKDEARREEEWETLARALDVEVHVLDRRGDIEGVRRVLREVEEVLERESVEARCVARTVLALNLYYGSPREALSAARLAVKEAEAGASKHVLFRAINRLMVVLVHQGLLGTDEGTHVISTGKKLAKNSGDRHLRYSQPLNRGVWHLDIGEFETAEHFFALAKEVAAEHPNDELDRTLLVNTAELHYQQKRIDCASRDFEKILKTPFAATPVYVPELARAGLGLCYLHEGKLNQALKLEDRLRDLPEWWYFDRYLIVLFRARLCLRKDSVEGAAHMVGEAAISVKDRFVLTWIKLRLEEARIIKRKDPARAVEIASAVVERAGDLGLRVRRQEAERLQKTAARKLQGE